MEIKKTKFKDLLIINKLSYKDNRGFFKEINKEKFLKKKFIFDYISLSKKNVLRGLHFQTYQPQGKLITVFQGKIFDVALDLRRKSKTYGQFFKTILSDKKNHTPGKLSGGQQQRVSIARSLVANPSIILADEPTGALDSKTGKDVIQILTNLNKENKTIIMITHDLELAKYAKRIIEIKDGEIIKDYTNKKQNKIKLN